MYGVFAVDLETGNVEKQLYCESYATGVYHLDRLFDCFNVDLTEELKIERENVHAFDRENNNPAMDMINYVIENYKGKAKFITNKHNKKLISSYKYQFVGQNASGFDNYIVLNPPPKSYTNNKIIKTSRGLIKLSFKAGSVLEDDREIPKYVKFIFPKCHISGSLKTIQKQYNIQQQLLKGEIVHDFITLSNWKHENQWKPYLIDDVLGLTYVISKLGNCVQKITGVSYKNSLRKSALAWSCLGN